MEKVTLRLSGSWHYKGKSQSHRNSKTFDNPRQARAYARKVIETSREMAGYRRGRNAGFLVNFISVWPEDVKVGDNLWVWNRTRGWHKGEVYAHRRYMGTDELRARSVEEGK